MEFLNIFGYALVVVMVVAVEVLVTIILTLMFNLMIALLISIPFWMWANRVSTNWITSLLDKRTTT